MANCNEQAGLKTVQCIGTSFLKTILAGDYMDIGPNCFCYIEHLKHCPRFSVCLVRIKPTSLHLSNLHFHTLNIEPRWSGLWISLFSSPQQPAIFELHTSTVPSVSSLKRGLKCSARSIWNLDMGNRK